MGINRFVFCVLLVAIVFTPLTAMNTNRFGKQKHQHDQQRRLHQQNKKHQKAVSGVPEFDQTRILEKNHTKNILLLGDSPKLLNNYGLPNVNPRFWKSGQSFPFDQDRILERAPQVSELKINENMLDINSFNNSDFNKDKCRGPAYKNEDKKLYGCKPRETIVHLMHEENLILSPSAVAVKRCDGACDAHSKCIPVESSYKTFHIRQFQNNEASCGTIEVLEHIRCKCSCPERSTKCTPAQIYDQEECKCKCPIEVNQKCPISKMVFNQQECKCKCSKVKQCSTGTSFDEHKCNCPRANAPTLGITPVNDEEGNL